MANALGVRFNATSTGTGDFVDASAVTGYRRGASILVDGSTYRYRAENTSGSEYEWGTGVWTNSTSTLARTTIFASSTGSKVSFTSVPQVAVVIFPDDVREVLTAARTYYVRTDGSDSNTGLANTAGGAFLTIAKALTVVGGIDTAAQQLTISVQAGTYTPVVSLPRVLGSLAPILTGVGSTTIISTNAAGGAIVNDAGGQWTVQSLKIVGGASTTYLLAAQNGGQIKVSGVEFGASSNYGMYADKVSGISATGNLTFSGSISTSALLSIGLISVRSVTVTISGTPAFGIFAEANFGAGYLDFFGTTISGSATGVRYNAAANSVIFTGGGGATYFPGNSAGTTSTGGLYS